MARPKKQTVEYFPHYVNSGKTMFILESNFGNDGYAFWFKVLELLGMTDGHVYDCRNTAYWEFLLAKTHVSEDIASRILQKLADLDAIDAELWKKRLIWSDNFVKNLLPLYSNRKSSLPKKPVSTGRNTIDEGFSPVETHEAEITTGENTQSKVKESKVKESKGEYIENSLSDKAMELYKYYSELKPGQNIAQHLGALEIDIEKYGYDWTKEAIQKCVSSKGKFIKAWVETVLRNWISEGKEEQSGCTGQNSKKNEGKYTGFKPPKPKIESNLDTEGLI